MNDVITVENNLSLSEPINDLGFANIIEFSNFLSNSTLVPPNYQRKPENCFIAIDMANRMNVPVMMVMQNLYVVQGKPSWSGTAVASMLRNCGQFEDVELVYVGTENTDNWGAYVTAKSKKTGKTLKGATVTIGIAKAEGWYNKTGSKWKTMPELMLCYRAYAWFGRQHAPEIMMGLQTNDEINDTTKDVEVVKNPYERN